MNNIKSKTLYLIDGTALAYRSYFAFIKNPLINSKGINTSGVYGFTNSMLRLLNQESPDYVACIFDTKAPTFRHEKYPEYKATREKMPEDLADQLPVIRSVVEALNIPLIEKEGFEADDVMGTLAKQGEAAGMDVIMVSGDKDMMQLVSKSIRMLILGRNASDDKGDLVGPQEVKEKMGVPPEHIIDLLGLMGDSSDNVPGVPGVGPKTALQLIESYGSLKEALDKADEIKKEKLKENLKTYRDQALLSKELVTLDVNVDVSVGLDELEKQEPDWNTLADLCKDLEFNRLLQEIQDKQSGDISPKRKYEYQIITDTESLDQFVAMLSKTKHFTVDLETTSLDPILAQIVGFSFSWETGKAAYVPVELSEEAKPLSLFGEESIDAATGVIEALKPILENSAIRKSGQNIKYDMRVMQNNGIRLQGLDFDTMVAGYLIDPSARRYNLDAMALDYLNIQKIPTEALIGKGKKQINMAEVPLEQIAEYACEDAEVTYLLREYLEPKLKPVGLDALFRDVEIPLIHVLIEMEENGVALDTEMLKRMSLDMQIQLDKLQESIYEMAGERFNINSTQQLGRILFEKLKVHEELGKRLKRTKTGYSTDVNVLESLSAHPLPKSLLDYRQLTKLKSTYVDALPKLINPKTGRLHASFNQTVAATGRLSSSDPNLQNIPIRTELGKEIRKAFVPEKEGWKILSADYSQIELRLMAHLSGDETLLESFRKGEDVHRRTASEIFGISPDEVTDDHRRKAKAINFGIMYGMGMYGLANRLEISNEEAQAFITSYFERYPKVNQFMADTIAAAHKDGYVTTLLNRRRYLPELVSDNRNVRDFGERTAINTRIQGTAADLIKIAMIDVSRQMKERNLQTKLILQIHDELVFEVPEAEMDQLKTIVRTEMEGALQLDVPIQVDMGVGENWLEAH